MDEVAPCLDLPRLHALCDAGRFATVYREVGESLDRAPTPELAWIGARMLWHLGAIARSTQLELATYRRAPRDPVARYLRAILATQRRSPFSQLALLADAPEGPPFVSCRWAILTAEACISLADFDAARAALERAERLVPGDAFAERARIELAFASDRHDEALSRARAVRGAQDGPYVAVSAARVLAELGLQDESVALLEDCAAATEAAFPLLPLADLLREAGRSEAAERALDERTRRLTLLGSQPDGAAAVLRADCAYDRGDLPRAADLLDRSGVPWLAKLARRLRDPARPSQRQRIRVPLVRQQSSTCFPATLTMIARHFGKPAEHLEVAEQICFDGTPTHSARTWAEQQGFVVREATLTWRLVVALCDRSIPFALIALGATAGHALVVTGYDARRGTVLLRDPSAPTLVEADAEDLLASFASTGPEAMIVVPAEDAATLLDGVPLVDAELYDHLHQVQRALARHDRDAAVRERDRLRLAAPDHRLGWMAMLAVAAYDGDAPARVAAAAGLLQRFPGDAFAEIAHLDAEAPLVAPAATIARLRSIVARPAAHPVFLQRLAEMLSVDARDEEAALRYARRAHARSAQAAGPLAVTGRIHARAGRFDRALLPLRLAASLEPTNEEHAIAHAGVLRMTGWADEATAFLRARHERFATRAASPTTTYAAALEDLGDLVGAEAALARGLEKRPGDGALLVATAALLDRLGRSEEAAATLTRAEGAVVPAAYLSVASALAASRGDLAASIRLAREAAVRAPLDGSVHEVLAARLAASEGPDAATAHLAEVSARFPQARHLGRLHVNSIRAPRARLLAVDGLLALHPEDAWALREHALVLSALGRVPEAEIAMQRALDVEPATVAALRCAAEVHLAAGRRAEAHALFLESVWRGPDVPSGIFHAVGSASGEAEKRRAVLSTLAALRAASASGACVPEWRSMALGILSGREIERELAALAAARPMWAPVAAARAAHLRDAGRFEEARRLAEASTRVFPHAPELWRELDRVAALEGDDDARVAALRRCRALAPADVHVALSLAAVLASTDRRAEADALLDRLAGAAPRDVDVQAALASRRAPDEACTLLLALGQRAPEAFRAFALAHEHASTEARRAEVWESLLAQTRSRPDDVDVQLAAASLAITRGAHDASLAAADAAIAASPGLVDAHSARALALALLGRHAEARGACRAAERPCSDVLRLREAWVDLHEGESERARASLRTLLDEEPAFSNAAVWLSRVCGEREETRDALRAAIRACRGEPESALAAGALSEAAFAAGRRRLGRRALAYLDRLAPGDPAVTGRLLQANLDVGRYGAASAILDRLRGAPPEWVARWRARILAARGDAEGAGALLLRLASEGPEDAYTAVVRALSLSPVGAAAADRVQGLIEGGGGAPFAGERHFRSRNALGEAWLPALLRLPPESPAARGGARVIAELAPSWPTVLGLLRHRGWLTRTTDAWAAFGALTRRVAPLLAATWLLRWRGRLAQIDAGALLVLLQVRESVGWPVPGAWLARGQELAAGPCPDALRARLAFEVACRGDLAGAEALAAGVAPEDLPFPENAALALSRSLIDAARSTGEDRRGALHQVRYQLAQVLPERTTANPLGARVQLHDRAAVALARITRNPMHYLRGRVDGVVALVVLTGVAQIWSLDPPAVTFESGVGTLILALMALLFGRYLLGAFMR